MSPLRVGSRKQAVGAVQHSLRHHVTYSLGKRWDEATEKDLLKAVAYVARDRVLDNLLKTESRYAAAGAKRLHFLSTEYLMGRLLRNQLANLGVLDIFEDALRALRLDFGKLESLERDAALGNGGLGRLAACLLDSIATLGMPGFGYGINYEFGLFRQVIEGGYQREYPDAWFQEENPWLIERAGEACVVPLYGSITETRGLHGEYMPLWRGWQGIVGVPYDLPIAGYGARTVNVLRLYTARASDEFDKLNGLAPRDYLDAVERKIETEHVSKVLYPSGTTHEARERRLVQEYFLVSCSVQDILRSHLKRFGNLAAFADKNVIHINDTHPALAVAELMRLLVDNHHLPWEFAWETTRNCTVTTIHTLMPEAFERWPVAMLRRVLPRHLEVIREINRRFLAEAIEIGGPEERRIERLALIEEGENPRVRMAHLAAVASRSINGVSAVHGAQIRSQLLPDIYALWPERFRHVTNGICPRRWLLQANPELAALLNRTIGCGWINHLDLLRQLEPCAGQLPLQVAFRSVKERNKQRLAREIRNQTGSVLDPEALFDVQIKRIHEYKRQLLNVLHIIHRYLLVSEDRLVPEVPRAYIFAGKAAPGNARAKLIIKLIHNVASVLEQDRRSRRHMRVVFLPDYRVSLAESIIPAADLSEQISTAGMEASGTGNMKLALNGALTIGTYDGSTIEMEQDIGAENMFLFGLRVDELETQDRMHARECYENNPGIRRVVDALASGRFSPGEPDLFQPIVDRLIGEDPYFHLADFVSYAAAQQRVDKLYLSPQEWSRKAILNIARMGRFSSDRTAAEYARSVWDLQAYFD